MRRSTFGKLRVVSSAEFLSHHIALPRGCLTAMAHLREDLGIGFDVRDERFVGRPVGATLADNGPPKTVYPSGNRVNGAQGGQRRVVRAARTRLAGNPVGASD